MIAVGVASFSQAFGSLPTRPSDFKWAFTSPKFITATVLVPAVLKRDVHNEDFSKLT